MLQETTSEEEKKKGLTLCFSVFRSQIGSESSKSWPKPNKRKRQMNENQRVMQSFLLTEKM